ncbi:MAG: histidinol-phosphate transaminase [Acidobacteriota bacterium]
MKAFRPEVLALRAYSMEEPALPVKANQNESPWDWPKELKREALARLAATPFHRYPAFRGSRLASLLCERWELPEGSCLLGNGSNELLSALFSSCLCEGRTGLLPSPSFSLYRQLALLSRGDVREVPLSEDLTYDAESWLDALDRVRPAVALVCSPNNPTGSLLSLADLERLLDRAPGIVAVDEAYGEFSGIPSAATLLPGRENLVVLRTFSKAWGSAALRLGYALAQPRVTEQVSKALLPYNVSPLALALGEAALSRREFFEGRVRDLIRGRSELFEQIVGIEGLRAYPSAANFILVRLQNLEAADVHSALKSRGVLVRDVSAHPALRRCLRISVGTPSEDAAVVEALKEVVACPAPTSMP